LFSEEEIDRISSYFKISEYPAGSVPVKAGEPLNLMGILVSGEAIYEEETEMKGKWIVQARMSRGSILAHPSMLRIQFFLLSTDLLSTHFSGNIRRLELSFSRN